MIWHVCVGYISMYRVINVVFETKTIGLRMLTIFKDGIWKLEALSDIDYANVTEV